MIITNFSLYQVNFTFCFVSLQRYNEIEKSAVRRTNLNLPLSSLPPRGFSWIFSCTTFRKIRWSCKSHRNILWHLTTIAHNNRS